MNAWGRFLMTLSRRDVLPLVLEPGLPEPGSVSGWREVGIGCRCSGEGDFRSRRAMRATPWEVPICRSSREPSGDISRLI